MGCAMWRPCKIRVIYYLGDKLFLSFRAYHCLQLTNIQKPYLKNTGAVCLGEATVSDFAGSDTCERRRDSSQLQLGRVLICERLPLCACLCLSVLTRLTLRHISRVHLTLSLPGTAYLALRPHSPAANMTDNTCIVQLKKCSSVPMPRVETYGSTRCISGIRQVCNVHFLPHFILVAGF